LAVFDDRKIAEPRANFRCFPGCECNRCRQLVQSQKNAKRLASKQAADTTEEKDLRKAKAKEYAYKATIYTSKEGC
jgi:hypothetical protein